MLATPSAAEPPAPEFPQALTRPLTAKYREAYLSQLLTQLRRQGHEGRYIDQGVLDEIEQNNYAQRRLSLFQQELRRDKNGDGVITIKEIKAGLPNNVTRMRGAESEDDVRRRVDAEVQKILTADANGDKKISLAEAHAFAGEKAKLSTRRRSTGLEGLLALDPNKDGKLTAEELLEIGKETFSHFDENGDAILDDEEMVAARDAINASSRAAIAARANPKQALHCKPPEAGRSEDVILISGYEGDAISSVSVAGMDRTTTTGKMIIEPGKKPLYIFATTFDPFIWRVEGDVKRVAKFVVVAQRANSGVGVVGVPKEKITFLPSGACFKYFSKPASGAALQAKAILETLVKRPVAKLIASYAISSIGAPSGVMPDKKRSAGPGVVFVKGPTRFLVEQDGTVTNLTEKTEKEQPAQAKADANTVAMFNRFSPGGVVEIDKKTVIASRPAEPYDVLPQQAGLIQLMEEDKIERLSDGTYYIKKPIARFPAGLAGGHSVKFMLAKDVPMPAGSPSHSCVISEETGKQLAGSSLLCR
ncbi:hypothetical protein CW354_07550 [Marinicaulis flavus]|uniref:EF-hand domain-containing protein n=1 Tax=Hyphococcus luteus TaxID=2058213 RepID=A0A2S7K6Q1_9PROT|nr:hypothetical protein CW354_07550 [Marinicaulis flavus]